MTVEERAQQMLEDDTEYRQHPFKPAKLSKTAREALAQRMIDFERKGE